MAPQSFMTLMTDINVRPNGFNLYATLGRLSSLKPWSVNEGQDIKGKSFPAFGIDEPGIYADYDLIYIAHGMLFNGSKHVDGRPFNKPENRPTNLQIPLVK
jgi:hypothetical protein